MANALIVSTTQYAVQLTELLSSVGYGSSTQAHSGTEAKRLMSEELFDLIIINTPLVDEYGYELAVQSAENTLAGVLLLAKADVSEAVEERVDGYGIVVLSKPVSGEDLYRTLKVLYANRRRLDKLLTSNKRLEDKIEELKLVDRAKCLLIMHEGMSEHDAHKYIEKKAMDLRISRREVAQKIISLKQRD